jgi:hypothetical protein
LLDCSWYFFHITIKNKTLRSMSILNFNSTRRILFTLNSSPNHQEWYCAKQIWFLRLIIGVDRVISAPNRIQIKETLKLREMVAYYSSSSYRLNNKVFNSLLKEFIRIHILICAKSFWQERRDLTEKELSSASISTNGMRVVL